jgi:hypothetical protein
MRRNVNPKSLKGREQIDRVRELMGKMQPLNESTSLSELELVKKGPNNVVYGIVRENHKYFIKTTTKTSGKIVAEDFDYIGGLQNKFSEAYNSYAAATKQLNLKFDMLNESLGINTHNNILESDGIAAAGYGFVIEEEEVEEEVVEEAEIEEGNEFTGALAKAKKEGKDKFKVGDKTYTVEEAESKLEEEEEKLEEKKVLKVDVPAPAEPAMEEPVEDEVDDFGGEEMDMEEPSMDMEEPAMDDEGDDEEDSTKKIQKLTGKIGQAIRELDIISALHLDEFSDEDIEDIIAKLEGEEEEDEAEAAEAGEMDMEEPAMEEEPAAEEEVEMEVTEESVVYTKSQLVESLTKKILKESIEEHHMGDSSPGQYDREAYITMDFEDSTYVDCPECMGAGCSHCDDLGYHLSNDFDMFDSEPHSDSAVGRLNIPADDFMALDIETGRQRPTDRDGDEIPSSDIDMDDDGDGILDTQEEMFEDDGYGVDVFDSISADFDTDKDGITAKIDNVYGDGEKVDRMNYFNDISRKGDDMGYDIKYFRGGDTITKPGTKDPIVKPKTPPKRGPWTKPTTVPNPQTTPKAVKEGDNMSKPKKRSFRRNGFYK